MRASQQEIVFGTLTAIGADAHADARRRFPVVGGVVPLLLLLLLLVATDRAAHGLSVVVGAVLLWLLLWMVVVAVLTVTVGRKGGFDAVGRRQIVFVFLFVFFLENL